MARTRHAQTEFKSASLSSEFGLSRAVWLFGQETVDSLARLQAGKNKGKVKGHVCWLVTTTAGFHASMGGGCKEGTTVRAWLGSSGSSGESEALTAFWLGRTQRVCGSNCVLGANNREAWMAEQARQKAEREAEMAEMLKLAGGAA